MEQPSCKIEENNQNNEPVEEKIKQEISSESISAKITENIIPKQNLYLKEFESNMQLFQNSNFVNYNLVAFANDLVCLPNSEIQFNDKKFKCSFPNCGAQFSQSSNLKRHYRIHTNEKPYTCKICQRAFNTSSNLKQHIQIHLTKDDRTKFICKACNKQYYYASNLKKHISIYHSSQKEMNLLETQLQAIEQQKELQLLNTLQPQFSFNQHQQQIFVKHNDHIDLLINGYLYFYDGKTVYIHQMESTSNNKYDEWSCYPMCELSHYSSLRELGNIYKAMEKTLDFKITYNQLMNQNNCNSFICTCKQMKEHPNGENCINNVIQTPSHQKNVHKGLCLCKETKPFIHKHSSTCGHIPIMHSGHTDYIVDGYLHFQHLDHCDNHGQIEIFTEQDLMSESNQACQKLQQIYSLQPELFQQSLGKIVSH